MESFGTPAARRGWGCVILNRFIVLLTWMLHHFLEFFCEFDYVSLSNVLLV